MGPVPVGVGTTRVRDRHKPVRFVTETGFVLKSPRWLVERPGMRLLFLALNRLSGERGQTMAEYGILIAVIALVVVIAAVTLGNSLSTLFHNTASRV